MKITKEDLSLALYGEITDEISRGNEDLVKTKIAIGTGEVYGYLNRYDVDTMFGEEWNEDLFFKALCVNVIVWHLSGLCNPNVSMEVIRTNYEDATKYLMNVQKGLLRPKWPLRPDDPETAIDEAGNVQWSSNRKRGSHY